MTARTTVARWVDELQVALASDAAFESWYRRTLPRVYSYLLPRCANDGALAEELTQQTFIAAVERRSRYDGRSDTVTWLLGIARHKLADHFRMREREERRRMRLEIRQLELGHGEVQKPGLDDRPAIADALNSLPTAQRAVLVLRSPRRPDGGRGGPPLGQESLGDTVAPPSGARRLSARISRGAVR